ncbi:MAG TPA: prepilin-type N-terminal cleavage/methylation domain-containing protein [Nitrospira sp.]|nr:prepilin-type N-terminal cleavage/methylation domain-containing protein [Nitrospira sp.]
MTRQCSKGFTLMELMVVVAIIGILGGIAVPSYLGYLDKARNARSIAEIRHIEKSVKLFYVNAERYPLTLAELGVDNIRDPWGTPYQYLNVLAVAAATMPRNGSPEVGDSNPWSWFLPSSAYATPSLNEGPGNGGGKAHGNGSEHGNGGQGGGQSTNAAGNRSGQPANAAGNGGGSTNSNLPAVISVRKDRFGAPLNTDFDLYSMGKNRESADSLSTPQSYDDIVRASDGVFVGLASEF